MMARELDRLSSTALCARIKEGICSLFESVFGKIIEHKIDGVVFLSLDDENLRKISLLLGDHLKIKLFISQNLWMLNTISLWPVFAYIAIFHLLPIAS